MNGTILLIIAVVFVSFLVVSKGGQISVRDALAHLKNGALVIDVRGPNEFSARHLPNAFNFPLDEIETTLPKRVPDKKQVLLLHCASGVRSGMARSKLKGLGYANVFNLGGYARASKISDAAGGC